MRSLQIVLALRPAEPIPRPSQSDTEISAAMRFGPSEQQVVGWALCFGLKILSARDDTLTECIPLDTQSQIKDVSLTTCYPESRRRALVSRSGEGSAAAGLSGSRGAVLLRRFVHIRLLFSRTTGSPNNLENLRICFWFALRADISRVLGSKNTCCGL